ncbi:hypothetical protein ONS95_006952 [Cadophora gregata]|uniref:uncharacterized protein n=1 Tax=Cadophora gregata TaxID=51156 RepID=UPI0026DC74A4|nr:uncharacterized protein ONS95_006952 [Cadophora gregata]KAK0101803.1 hypothetical protein ONS95_006952 [Cadophora gregata]
MSQSDIYSTTADYGSVDGDGSSPPNRPPADISANVALSTQRIATFVADTSLSPPIASHLPILDTLTAATPRQLAAVLLVKLSRLLNRALLRLGRIVRIKMKT